VKFPHYDRRHVSRSAGGLDALLYTGQQSLNPAQRIGSGLYGFLMLVLGVGFLWAAIYVFPFLMQEVGKPGLVIAPFVSVVMLLVGVAFTKFAWRLIVRTVEHRT
jgi:hypothetical protein